MNPFSTWFDLPETALVGWWIMHSLWQGALIAAAFAVVRLGLRERSASLRYVAACVALAIIVVAPVLTVVGSTHFIGRARFQTFEAIGQTVPPSGANPVLPFSGFSGASHSWFLPYADFLARLAPSLCLLWLLGVLICSVKLTRSCWSVHLLRNNGTDGVELRWIAMMNRLRRQFGITRPVLLLKSALVEVPTVIGWLRPMILLPAATLTGLSPQQVEAILAHELAHVRRFDLLINNFQCLVETFMFYHPAVWWISGCIREERENCCDDLVLGVGANRVEYARALATLEQVRAPLPAMALCATGGPLLNRIRRLLGVRSEQPATARHLVGLLLVGLGLILALSGIISALDSPRFTAVVRLKVQPDETVSGDGSAAMKVFDQSFLPTQFEVIRSDLLLGRVVANLRLDKHGTGKALSRREAIAMLRRRLSFAVIRNTSLLELRASSEDPQQAAELANAVALAYRDYRIESARQPSLAGIHSLEDRFKEQDKKARDKQTEVESLRRQFQIPDALPDENVRPISNTPDVMRKLEELRIETKARLVGEATLLKGLKSLSPEHALAAISTAAPDALLTAFMEQLNLAEQRLLALQVDYSREHPEFVKANRQLEDLQKKVSKRVEGIMIGLEHRAESSKEILANLEKEIEQCAARDSSRAEQWRPYYAAKRELEQLQRFQQILNLKLASEKLDVSLPATVRVQIIDEAVPPLRASAPNRPRSAAMIFFGLVLDVAGFSLLRGKSKAELPAAT